MKYFYLLILCNRCRCEVLTRFVNQIIFQLYPFSNSSVVPPLWKIVEGKIIKKSVFLRKIEEKKIET